MTVTSVNTVSETRQQRFERILNLEPFKGLKAILDNLSRDQATLCDGVHGTNSYEELLAKLGYKVTVVKQIHVADSYSRTGPAGGIKRQGRALPLTHVSVTERTREIQSSWALALGLFFYRIRTKTSVRGISFAAAMPGTKAGNRCLEFLEQSA